jgi:hypothetical protein
MNSAAGNSRESLSTDSIRVRITCETPGLKAGSVREGAISSGRLSVTATTTLRRELRSSASLPPIRTRENPCLPPSQLARLDEHGVVRIGSVVCENDTLVSIVVISGPKKNGKAPIRDISWTVPLDWDHSEVLDARFESSTGRRREFPRGVLEKLLVTLRRTIPFCVGDSLSIEGVTFATNGTLLNDKMPCDSCGTPADVVVPLNIAQKLGLGVGDVRECDLKRTGTPVADQLNARATGRYSLITMMPQGSGLTRKYGQQVTAEQLAWLYDRRLFALLTEFISLRSQDLENRQKLKGLAEGNAVVDAIIPAAPESLFEVVELLWGLGLAVSLRSEEGCVSVELKPASDDEIVQRSHGEIRKPDTIHYRTFRPESGGLFCETVFGSERSLLRRRRAGHIELTEPVIPVMWRRGPDSILGNTLGISEQDLDAILSRTALVFVRNGEILLKPSDGKTKIESDSDWTHLGTGCEAIQALLKKLPREAIPDAFGPKGEQFFTRRIYMIPPDLRPLVLLDSGNFATSDLNDMYRLVINRNNRLRKLKELGAPEVIIHNEIRILQLEVDRLHANRFIPPFRQLLGNGKRPLRSLSDMLAIRIQNSVQLRVEWCGQAHCLASSLVEHREVHLPAEIFDELRLSESTPVLLSSEAGVFLARRPRRIDGQVIVATRDDGEILLASGSIVAVHRPMTPAAVAEAEQLLSGNQQIVGRFHSDDWCQIGNPGSVIPQIAAAAVSQQPVSMKSLHGVALFGTGSITSTLPREETGQNTERESYWMELPPKEEQPVPTLEEMAAVIRGHGRSGCLLHVERTDIEPPPRAGRIGGIPWMPIGYKWPVKPNGEPYEFVGQFPLDEARNADSLPFTVPAGSLLTVFSNGDWDCCATTRDGSLLIHSSEGLQPLEPARQGDFSGALCKVTPEVVHLFPTLKEALPIVDWELESPDKSAIKLLEDAYASLFRNPRHVSRIGGYPHWIQNTEEITFVAQICSDGVSDLMFGDAGAIFIHGKSPDSLEAFIQCY